jgi:hypothetical protein
VNFGLRIALQLAAQFLRDLTQFHACPPRRRSPKRGAPGINFTP